MHPPQSTAERRCFFDCAALTTANRGCRIAGTPHQPRPAPRWIIVRGDHAGSQCRTQQRTFPDQHDPAALDHPWTLRPATRHFDHTSRQRQCLDHEREVDRAVLSTRATGGTDPYLYSPAVQAAGAICCSRNVPSLLCEHYGLSPEPRRFQPKRIRWPS